jgi:putative tricarboxylic transport membrane protein
MAPANPGGGWDQTARLIQQVLVTQKIVEVPLEVANRPGAGGTIGLAEFITANRSDPHTILVLGRVMLGAILTNHSAVSLSDTVPLARLLNEYEVIAVPADSKYQTFGELINDFKKDPAHVSWGGGSAGGTDHILVAMIADAAGVGSSRINYIAHSGGGEAAVAVMGGHVTAGVSGFGEWKPYAQSGRLRFLAVSSDQRITGSSTPTIRESGLDVVLANWRSVAAPPGTGDDARAWWVAALERMRDSSAWKQILVQNDWEDSFLTGPEFEKFLADETRNNAEVLNAMGLVPNASRYPYIIGLGLLLSLLWLWRIERGRSRSPAPPVDRIALAGTAALVLLYILLFERLGYIVTTTALIFLTTRILRSRQWLRDLIASVVVSASAYFLFEVLLKKGLP